MSNALGRLMKRPDRGSRLAGNVLTKMFRDVLATNNVTKDQLLYLIELYLQSPANQIEMEGMSELEKVTKLSTIKGNLISDMIRDTITFKVFVKLMEVLPLQGMSLTLQGHLRGGDAINLRYVNIDAEGELEDAITMDDFTNAASFMSTVRSGKVDAPPIEGDFIELVESM